MAECEVCGRYKAQSAGDYYGGDDKCGREVATGIAATRCWSLGYERLRDQVAALTARAEAAEAKAERMREALREAATALGDARGVLSHCWASETSPDKQAADDADAAEDAARAAMGEPG